MNCSYWGVMPAAGRGERFASVGLRDVPKQYVEVAGARVIEHSLAPLLRESRLEVVVVSLGADDKWWPQTHCAADPRVVTCIGGANRAQSVRNALGTLEGKAQDDDWVLVHDAVRPCLSQRELSALIETLDDDPVGGLLVTPVSDTMKTLAGGTVERTLERDRTVHALTPQMFRFKALVAALAQAAENGVAVTDEAQAMECAGHEVRVVRGDAANVKLTYPYELRLIETWLENNPPRGGVGKSPAGQAPTPDNRRFHECGNSTHDRVAVAQKTQERK